MPLRQAAFATVGRISSCRRTRLTSAPPWQVAKRNVPRSAGAGVADGCWCGGPSRPGRGLSDDVRCMRQSYIQKIRPARAPKGPGRPFSSERGKEDGNWLAKRCFARLKEPPKELNQPPVQPWPFFFLATFLAAFFFFFAIVMAPCHEHPHCYTTIPPGALLEGTDDVSRRVESSRATLLTRCSATLHRAANGVVKDDSENCQEMFRTFFEKSSQKGRCTPPADALRTLTRGGGPSRDQLEWRGSLPTP